MITNPVSSESHRKTAFDPAPERRTLRENNMRLKTAAAFVVGFALCAPIAIRAAADDDDHRNERDRQRDRYYDSRARDYHTWNDNEDRAYRNYLRERNRDYREFHRLNRRDQSDYWRWRHNHQDRDDMERRTR